MLMKFPAAGRMDWTARSRQAPGGPDRNETFLEVHVMAEAIVTKRCPRCNTQKPLSDFSPDKTRGDGVRSTCRSCCSKKSAAYRKTPRGREKASAWMKTENGRALQKRVRDKIARTDYTRAHGVIGSAVYSGRMPAASTLLCVRCGKQAAHYHHHQGYAKENHYNVIPVCAQCHKDIEGL
jgi:hypothetical protein